MTQTHHDRHTDADATQGGAKAVIFAFVAFESLDSCGHVWTGSDFRPQLQRLCHGRAVTENGTVLDADHPSSSPFWSRHDMTDHWKRDTVYAAAFPAGFEVVWLDAPLEHPVVGPMLRDRHPQLVGPALATERQADDAGRSGGGA